MNFNSSFNIHEIDRQLVILGMELKNRILANEVIKNDDYFAKIYEIAQKWDKVFQDSLATGKGA